LIKKGGSEKEARKQQGRVQKTRKERNHEILKKKKKRKKQVERSLPDQKTEARKNLGGGGTRPISYWGGKKKEWPPRKKYWAKDSQNRSVHPRGRQSWGGTGGGKPK